MPAFGPVRQPNPRCVAAPAFGADIAVVPVADPGCLIVPIYSCREPKDVARVLDSVSIDVAVPDSVLVLIVVLTLHKQRIGSGVVRVSLIVPSMIADTCVQSFDRRFLMGTPVRNPQLSSYSGECAARGEDNSIADRRGIAGSESNGPAFSVVSAPRSHDVTQVRWRANPRDDDRVLRACPLFPRWGEEQTFPVNVSQSDVRVVTARVAHPPSRVPRGGDGPDGETVGEHSRLTVECVHRERHHEE